jgi:archaemetzincin
MAPDDLRRTLALAPLGMAAHMTSWKEILREGLEAFYSLSSLLIRPILLSEVRARSRINEGTGKRQFHSQDILDFLKQRLPADAFAIAAITSEDLYPDESWNFVFGQASLRDRVGVFSFARYDPRFEGDESLDERLILSRTLKVLSHEVGHMFGLQHCVYFSCLMNGANNLEEADATPLHVCPVCSRKLQRAIGFDVIVRYEALEVFWRSAGFPKEASWVGDRLREVRAAA